MCANVNVEAGAWAFLTVWQKDSVNDILYKGERQRDPENDSRPIRRKIYQIQLHISKSVVRYKFSEILFSFRYFYNFLLILLNFLIP